MKFVLGSMEGHLKNDGVIRQRQHGFTKDNSCLTNLISFYDKVTCPVDEEKVVNVVFLDFSKAFDTASYPTVPCEMSEFVVCWLNSRAEKVLVSGATCKW